MMPAMSLQQLFADLVDVGLLPDCTIQGLALDSRKIRPGDLYLAIPGSMTDGRRYLQQALDAGAGAVAYEADAASDVVKEIYDLRDDPRCFAVKGLRQRCGLLAARYYQQPSRDMEIIAVTGTNGKSTVCWLLAQALTTLGRKCAVIGTLGCGFPPDVSDTGLTTPDPVSLHQQLASLRSQGATAVAIELSSHGLDQYRDQGLEVNRAVFTNLTRDHLDYHGNYESYIQSKLRLFCRTGLEAIIVNDDDPISSRIRHQSSAPIISYGRKIGAINTDLEILSVQATEHALKLHLQFQQSAIVLDVPLLGEFNASNIAAVVCVLLTLQLPLSEFPWIFNLLQAPPGRMEYFTTPDQHKRAVVDFAHTPDALARALSSLRPHTPGQLWCVFGCGGDRDVGKRPQMGAIAEQLADQVLLTDDNTRHEMPAAIVADIEAGMQQPHRVIHDRLVAIRTALMEAGEQDLVLIAGKGHEQTQQIGDICYPFSDRDVVQDFLGLAA